MSFTPEQQAEYTYNLFLQSAHTFESLPLLPEQQEQIKYSLRDIARNLIVVYMNLVLSHRCNAEAIALCRSRIDELLPYASFGLYQQVKMLEAWVLLEAGAYTKYFHKVQEVAGVAIDPDVEASEYQQLLARKISKQPKRFG